MCYVCFVKEFLSNTLQRIARNTSVSKRVEGGMSRWPVSYIRHLLHIGLNLQQAKRNRLHPRVSE